MVIDDIDLIIRGRSLKILTELYVNDLSNRAELCFGTVYSSQARVGRE